MAKEMKISNEKSIKVTMHILAVLLFSDILFLLFFPKLLGISSTVATILGMVIFLLIIWRFRILKIAVLETSEYLFSLKYRHPFQSRKTPPVLEIPLDKLEYCKLKYGFPDSFLIVKIDTVRGKRKFYYRLGILSKRETENFRKVLNN